MFSILTNFQTVVVQLAFHRSKFPNSKARMCCYTNLCTAFSAENSPKSRKEFYVCHLLIKVALLIRNRKVLRYLRYPIKYFQVLNCYARRPLTECNQRFNNLLQEYFCCCIIEPSLPSQFRKQFSIQRIFQYNISIFLIAENS